MKLLVIALALFLFGCTAASRRNSLTVANILPPPNEDSETEQPKPDIQAFRNLIDQFDRVRISYHNRDHSLLANVELTSREPIENLRGLLQDDAIVASFNPPVMFLDPSMISTYRGDTLLFVFHLQSPRRIMVTDHQNMSFGGSYIVSEKWYERFLKFCEEWRPKEPNHTAEPSSPSRAGSP